MKAVVPAVRAVMGRRILVNFRLRPDVVAGLLPSPFRPQLVSDWAMGGICLIRLEAMRPAWLPRALGVASENAAHRIAVEWFENGRKRFGVFIPRRDTDSVINQTAGGRLFPGVHYAAEFVYTQDGNRVAVELRSRDGETRVSVAARLTDIWPAGSVFKTLNEASEFFRHGGCGWSPTSNCALEGVELRTEEWTMRALAVERVESSFFNDPRRFPSGSVEFDSALLMQGIHHEWRALGKFAERSRDRPRDHHRTIPFLELP